MVDIRLARPEDAPAIARVHVAVWNSTYRGLIDDALIDEATVEQREAMWTDILTAYTETHPVLVAEDFGIGICGFGNAGPLRGEDVLGYSGEFKTLYLLPAYQRRGFGRALLTRLAAELLKRGHDSALAWVLASNPACGFYEAMGGVICAQRVADEEEGESHADLAYGWSDLAALARSA
ncbi:MAG TPA: GNAT family N-acetyltransferase [Stellaceae bacterium]|jgi:GNAT superfamily N-acetyltransferase|nr:GNAT family N-acetyltransferase [Stellaceae bacterium]